jgi:orotidine-5'-phosphate decarboxylase
MTYQQKLDTMIKKNNSLLCVGLDPEFTKLPNHILESEHPQYTFNTAIIDATHDLVAAFKPNSAFYEAFGDDGIYQLKLTCEYILDNYPETPIILDAKRADIGNTNNGYSTFAYEYLQADAITLSPYLGSEALKPFLEREDKGNIILCKTSNSGGGEFQNLTVDGKPLYEHVAAKVAHEWNTLGNCNLVVGATYPEELKRIREIVGDMTMLVPGIGAQGGNVEKTVKAGVNSQNAGLLINSSRGIIFASSGEDFAERARDEAMKLKDEINKYRS